MFEGSFALYANHEGEKFEGDEFDQRAGIVDLLVKCRESITENSSILGPLDEFVEKNRERVEGWLDSYFSCQQVGAVEDIVRRTVQFSRLEATTIPAEQTALYIIEANRAYIHGFFLSSVAMARSALEHALKEKFRQLGVLRIDGDFLGKKSVLGLVEAASRTNSVLSAESIEVAREWARKCNVVMHSRPERSESKVLEILLGIRFLLEEIYSPDVG